MRRVNLPVLILIISVALVAIFNFTSSYLIGWDNLLSEMNLGLAIKGSVFSVWQNEALGFLSGNAHAADLPRQILLLPLSLLPLNLIRQIFTFAMLLVGGLGAFFLIRKLVFYEKNRLLNLAIPLIGAMFYIFNLSTIQTFYVPFEPFVVHFAFLPWLILVALNLIANRNRKSLLFFLLVNFLAIPQAQVPTIFFVYLFSLSFFLFVLVWETKRREILRSSIKVVLLTLLLNSFWLLPFLYFYFTNSHVAFEAKINQMSTPTVFLQNKEFGGLANVIILKGFWFNNLDPNKAGVFDFMMKPWRDYLSGLPSFLEIISFFFILLGFIYVKRKSPFVIPFSALFLLSFTMLATNTPPFSWIDSLLRSIPIFTEVFRFPFTKFSILASLTYAFFFAIGVGKLSLLHPGRIKKILIICFSLLTIFLLVLPIFRGNLFYQNERVNFPPEYFKLANYFSSKPAASRVANFPQSTLFGWNYYRWGYGGSGFLWYLIPQPILDRAFDVWSKESENYYWEISYALYSKNGSLFRKVLEKYNVEYLILDKNVESAYSEKSLYIPELTEILEKDGIKKDATFGKIDVYKLPGRPPLRTIPASVNGYKFGDFDKAYSEFGSYIATSAKNADIVYPFRSLFSNKNEGDKEYEVRISDDSITFISNGEKANVSKTRKDYSLNASDVKNCDNFRKGSFSAKDSNGNIRLSAKDAISCLSLKVDVSGNQGYLLTVENKNIKGRGLHVWVSNLESENTLIDTYLSKNGERTTSYFVIPPQDPFSFSYSIHLDNVSIAEETINEIGKISLYPVPYDELTSFKRVNKVQRPVEVLTSNEAYNAGWRAYELGKDQILGNFLPFIFGKGLKEHVLVNNWENGWVLDRELNPNEQIVIVFLPQYLEYLGFLIVLGTIVYALKS